MRKTTGRKYIERRPASPTPKKTTLAFSFLQNDISLLPTRLQKSFISYYNQKLLLCVALFIYCRFALSCYFSFCCRLKFPFLPLLPESLFFFFFPAAVVFPLLSFLLLFHHLNLVVSFCLNHWCFCVYTSDHVWLVIINMRMKWTLLKKSVFQLFCLIFNLKNTHYYRMIIPSNL